MIGLCKSIKHYLLNFQLNVCIILVFYRDRIRTSVNILGDGIGAGIVDHLVRDELEPIDLEEGEDIDKSIQARRASRISAVRRMHSHDDFNEPAKL